MLFLWRYVVTKFHEIRNSQNLHFESVSRPRKPKCALCNQPGHYSKTCPSNSATKSASSNNETTDNSNKSKKIQLQSIYNLVQNNAIQSFHILIVR